MSSDADDGHDGDLLADREANEAAALPECDRIPLAERLAGVDVAPGEAEHRRVQFKGPLGVRRVRGDGAGRVQPSAPDREPERDIVHEAVPEASGRAVPPKR